MNSLGLGVASLGQGEELPERDTRAFQEPSPAESPVQH